MLYLCSKRLIQPQMWPRVPRDEVQLAHKASHSQSTDSSQPTRRSPSLNLCCPCQTFSHWSNIRWHYCATWKPLKEMQPKMENVSNVAVQPQNTKAPEYMLPLRNHILLWKFSKLGTRFNSTANIFINTTASILSSSAHIGGKQT